MSALMDSRRRQLIDDLFSAMYFFDLPKIGEDAEI